MSNLKQAGIFLLFVLGFWAVSAIYLSPAIGGEKVLIQGDMQQVRLMRAEMDSFKVRYGEYPGWSDGMFSGMPTTLITGIPTGNYVYKTGVMELFRLVGTPFNFLFVAMLSMFILLISSGVNRWLAAAGGLGYAFMTFSITSYEAGHITKVLAMGVMPGMLAGLILINRKKYLYGAAVLGVFFSLVVGYFHYQIAYYAGIIAGIFIVTEFIRAAIAKDTKHALSLAAISGVAMIAGVAANIGKLVDTAEYSSATMRGGSELASELPKNGPQQQTAKKGLERDYAFAWSYSPEECLTLLVPRIKGGSSGESVGMNDITQDDSRLPLYHGDLSFTSGPVYLGAVFMLLFVLGVVAVVFLSKSDPAKYSVAKGIMWFSVITFAVSLILAWGRFFGINDLLFDYLPYYNKFRTPMMALSIAQVVVPFFGLYALQLFLQAENKAEVSKNIFKFGGIAAGSLMAIAAIAILSSDYVAPGDADLGKKGWPLDMLRDIRSSEAWKDWLRSLVFMAIPLGLIWYAVQKNLSKIVLWVGLILLVAVDMVGVSKRYLGEENWQYKEEEEAIVPTPKDAELMKFNKNHARVFDLRYNPFNDAHSAPWHRSIGGYHPAKLSRYQDLISYCITPNGGNLSSDWVIDNNALDMLNCEYILTMSQDGKSEQVMPRTTALGNAWFVDSVVHVPSAKAAVETINAFNPATSVTVEDQEKLKPSADVYSKDSTASIRIKYYMLDTIKYAVTNANKGLAVFSEIFYNEKNGRWKAFADGKELPVLRVNYILRGLELPAGTKEVIFIYEKQSNRYFTLEAGVSGLLLLLLAFVVVKGILANNGKENSDTVDA